MEFQVRWGKTGQNIMKKNWTLTKKEKAIREIDADAR